MHYLLEHVVVDVEHAEGWLNHVIAPLAAMRPDLLGEVGIGILRRLDCALAVCDRAMRELRLTGRCRDKPCQLPRRCTSGSPGPPSGTRTRPRSTSRERC